MNKIIEQLARTAQNSTPADKQLELVIQILEDAVRRLQLLKEQK